MKKAMATTRAKKVTEMTHPSGYAPLAETYSSAPALGDKVTVLFSKSLGVLEVVLVVPNMDREGWTCRCIGPGVTWVGDASHLVPMVRASEGEE